MYPNVTEVAPCVTDKYIGFDIDCNETAACVVEKGKKDYHRSFTMGEIKLRMIQSDDRLTITYGVVILDHASESLESERLKILQ